MWTRRTGGALYVPDFARFVYAYGTILAGASVRFTQPCQINVVIQ